MKVEIYTRPKKYPTSVSELLHRQMELIGGSKCHGVWGNNNEVSVVTILLVMHVTNAVDLPQVDLFLIFDLFQYLPRKAKLRRRARATLVEEGRLVSLAGMWVRG